MAEFVELVLSDPWEDNEYVFAVCPGIASSSMSNHPAVSVRHRVRDDDSDFGPAGGVHLDDNQVAGLATWLASHVPADRIADVTAAYVDARNRKLGPLPPVETWGE